MAPAAAPPVLPNTVVKFVQPQMRGLMSFAGAATTDQTDLQPYLHSEHVDMQREYSYPEAYKGFAMCLATTFFFTAVPGYMCSFVMEKARAFSAPLFVIMLMVTVIACITCYGFAYLNYYWYARYPATHPQPLSVKEFRHVVGSSWLSVSSIGWFVLCLAGHLLMDRFETHEHPFHNTLLFMWTTLSAGSLLTLLWLSMNSYCARVKVSWSFVISMFMSGHIFVIAAASYFNTKVIVSLWPTLSPDCHIGMVMSPQSFGSRFPDASAQCMRAQWIQWFFTTGIEEGFKFAMLLRLRTSLHEITSSCWLTRCPRSTETPIPCCGWMLKFAASPIAILLAGVASGGGFATMENVSYVYGQIMKLPGNQENPWAPMIRVPVAFFHMMWTGINASAFAFEKFAGPQYGFVKYVTMMVTMTLHGSWNCFSIFDAMSQVDPDYKVFVGSGTYPAVLTICIFILALVSVLKLEHKMPTMDAPDVRDVELSAPAQEVLP